MPDRSLQDDQDLLRRLEAGDPAALSAVYHRYKDHLLTVATGLLIGAATAEDALHDAFVAFAGKVRDLNLRGGLRGYLVACVANRARDELRRRSRQPASLEGLDPPTRNAADPAVSAVRQDEAVRVQLALAELPYEQREVLVLHLQGELTFREIADQLGVSINTVQSRYRYGLEKLRSLMSAGVAA